ncbi:hypothetical protein D3C87_1849010 [compost metagenome]
MPRIVPISTVAAVNGSLSAWISPLPMPISICLARVIRTELLYSASIAADSDSTVTPSAIKASKARALVHSASSRRKYASM